MDYRSGGNLSMQSGARNEHSAGYMEQHVALEIFGPKAAKLACFAGIVESLNNDPESCGYCTDAREQTSQCCQLSQPVDSECSCNRIVHCLMTTYRLPYSFKTPGRIKARFYLRRF